MPEALENFHQDNILIVEEEGYTSHMRESYVQQIANILKVDMRHLIYKICNYLKSNIDQYIPLATLCIVLDEVFSTDTW